MKFDVAVTRFQPSAKPGAVLAHADIRLDSEAGSLSINGFSIVQANGKPVWVGFPQKQGRNANKYFPVVIAEGPLKEMIVNRILDEYQKHKQEA